jgi:hypothetical protein
MRRQGDDTPGFVLKAKDSAQVILHLKGCGDSMTEAHRADDKKQK